MSNLIRHPVIIAAALLAAGLLVWGFWPSPALVETVTAKRAPLTVSIEEEGRTRVIDRYTIAAPVDGETCRIDMQVGDPVSQGETLLTISPLHSQVLDPRSRAQAIAKVKSAQAALLAAEQEASAADSSAKLAQSDYDRLKPLMEKKLVSKEAFEQATTRMATAAATRHSAKFNVDVARYELEAAKSVLQYAAQTDEAMPVRSPIRGKVLKIARKCEGPIRTGDPILVVGDPSALEVEVDVLSADAVKIKPGMKVLFDRWGGETPLEGIVKNVEPVAFTKVSALGVEEQRVYVIADFTSPRASWQSLGDGYRVEARFVIWHQDDVLQVPSSSLFRYGDGWALFTLEKGRARRHVVTVGQRNGLMAQISGGITAGTTVINHPSDDVDDGRRVRVKQ